MKKYLRFSLMALFAMLALTVVSCSKDDDDEPDNSSGSGSITLTLDGTKYTFDSGVSTFDSDEILIELFTSNFTPWINFVFYEPYELSNGMDLTSDMEVNGTGPVVLNVVNYDGRTSGWYELESGSVKINSINLSTKKLQVTFNNAVFEETYSSYGNSSIKVSGSFSVSLDAEWGIAG